MNAATPEDLWSASDNHVRERYDVAVAHQSEEWVLQFADSLENINPEYEFFAQSLRYDYAFYHADSAMFYSACNRIVEIADKKDFEDEFFRTYTNSVSFSLNCGHIYIAQKTVKIMLDEAKRRNYAIGLFWGYLSLSSIHGKKGEFIHSVEAAEEAYKYAETMDDDRGIRYRVYALQGMMNNYGHLGQYDKTFKCGEKVIELVGDDPFALLCMSEASYEKGDIDAFYDYYYRLRNINKVEEWQYPVAFAMMHVNIMYQTIKGNTKMALAMCDSLPSYVDMLTRKIDVYRKTEQWDKAFALQTELRAYNDSIYRSVGIDEVAGINAELDTVIKSVEKDRQISVMHWIIMVSIMAFVLSVVISVFYYHRHFIVNRKNKALVKHIDQLMKYKKRYSDTYNEVYLAKLEKQASEGVEDHSLNSEMERFVFELTSRKLFTDSDFNRNSLLNELNMSKRTFAKDFESTFGCSFSRYIQTLRVELAAMMIKEHPEFTIEAIARDCGITSNVTFYRHFTNHFGINPSAYRQISTRQVG